MHNALLKKLVADYRGHDWVPFPECPGRYIVRSIMNSDDPTIHMASALVRLDVRNVSYHFSRKNYRMKVYLKNVIENSELHLYGNDSYLERMIPTLLREYRACAKVEYACYR